MTEESKDAPEDPAALSRGIGQLVVGLVDTLRQVLEAQAVARFDEGTLTDDEAERLGNALSALEAKMPELREMFDLPPDADTSLNLGTVEGVSLDLREALDTLITKGLVVRGTATLALADVALAELDLAVGLRASGRDRPRVKTIDAS